MNKDASIYVAGHRGLVGSAVVRRLQRTGYTNLLVRTRAELNLLDGTAVSNFFKAEAPEYVVDCAARVGGIRANMTYPSEFLYENTQIQNNLIWSAKEADVRRFLFLGSSCVYPRDCVQPMKEECLFEGRPEATNEAYAVAKMSGIKLCEYIRLEFDKDFLSIMPTNIYGQNDNFDPESSHVIPALMHRMHAAFLSGTDLTIWGTGDTRREFMHVDDLADAIVWILEEYSNGELLNVGTGLDLSIRELAQIIRECIGFEGNLIFDPSLPDGMPRKLLDVSKLEQAGWKHKIGIGAGLRDTYQWYLQNIAKHDYRAADRVYKAPSQ